MIFQPRKPFVTAPLVDVGDSLSQGQIGWWLANEGAGPRLLNVANPNRFNGAIQLGATWQRSQVGNNLAMSGASNSYVDLGTQPLISGTSPFTLHWLEFVGASPPAYSAVACFMPAGNTQRFIILREDSDAHYARLCCGLGSVTNVSLFASAPTMASGVGIWRQWILYSASGMNTAPGSGFGLIVDGVFAQSAISGSGGGLGSLTGNFNYLGWDGADNNWKGAQDGFRLWDRVLISVELNRLIADPFAGARSRRLLTSGAPPSLPRQGSMLLAM